jgi:NAD(P)-dependent dehydrogenase (short-subunit alcohol dehydrogenase family)
MKPPKSQVIIVTGATRGIGRATALLLANKGHAVVATGRNEGLLASLQAEAQGLPLTAAAMDVTSDRQVGRVVSETLGRHGRIDAVVNNAGYGLWGPLEDLTVDEVRVQVDTNVVGPLRLSQAVLPAMRKQGFGTIVNVGSISGITGTPAGGAYSASKAALLQLSRIMRIEVAQFGVRVVLVEPGLYATDFHTSQVDGARVGREDSPYRSNVQRMLQRRPRRPVGQNPRGCALLIANIIAARRPKFRYTAGADAFLAARIIRFVPDGFLNSCIRRFVGW